MSERLHLFAGFLAKQSHTCVPRIFSPMRNSVQSDIVTVASQDFILLAGVHSVADHLALGKKTNQNKVGHSVNTERIPRQLGCPCQTGRTAWRDVSTPSITILTVFTVSSQKDSATCCWEKIFHLRCASRKLSYLNTSTAGKCQPVRPT